MSTIIYASFNVTTIYFSHLKNAGLLDISVDAESIAKEIIKCVDMAIDGIHAFLFVLSVRNRFSREEEYALSAWSNCSVAKLVTI